MPSSRALTECISKHVVTCRAIGFGVWVYRGRGIFFEKDLQVNDCSFDDEVEEIPSQKVIIKENTGNDITAKKDINFYFGLKRKTREIE